ncbi:MAG: mandelate racemase/muconate lactonizing enzyme family protein, partial [Alphaproteobacteria bacterium]
LALWDIAGQAARVPVHRLLGGARRHELEVYATHPLGATLEATAAAVRALIGRGFRAVKMGWAPLGPDPEHDEAIVRTLREAAGPDVKVLVDGGNAWDAAGALERCRRFQPYDVFWLEEPLAPDDLDGYRAVTRAGGLTIAAGELCEGEGELVRLVREGGVGVVQVDVSRTGLTQAMRIAAVAAAAGTPCVNHTYTLDLNLAASLHFMAAAPLVSLCEVQGAPNPLRELLFPSGPRARGATITVPDEAGLGVRPDTRALADLGAGA